MNTEEIVSKGKECLKEYVEKAKPLVNIALRNGQVSPDASFLDQLFREAEECAAVVYRGLPNSVIVMHSIIYSDMGYMSTSKDLSEALRFAPENDAALLIIQTNGIRGLNVNALLEGHNNEDEVLLPRGLSLELLSHKRYSQDSEDESTSIKAFVQEHEYDLYEKLNEFQVLNVYNLRITATTVTL